MCQVNDTFMTLPIDPYRLPLDRDAFRRALRIGHGRVFLHLRAHGVAGLTDDLVEACTCDVVNDAQIEGTRVEWLWGLIEAGGVQDRVVPRVLAIIDDGLRQKDYWTKVLLVDFAQLLTRRGYAGARERLYACVHKDPDSAHVFGIDEIVELDGRDGLLFAADAIGGWILNDAEFCGWSDMDEQFDDRFGQGRARKILQAASRENPNIAAFVAYHDELRSSTRGNDSDHSSGASPMSAEGETARRRRPRAWENWTVDDILREIQDVDPAENGHRYLYMRWGESADIQDLNLVFEALLAEIDAGRCRLLIAVFQDRGFPKIDRRCLAFADHSSDEVRWAAYFALSKHTHEDVQRLALERIAAGRLIEGELRLLINNHRFGDWTMIRSALRDFSDSGDMHTVLMTLHDIYGEMDSPEATEPLMTVYEHSPCSMCRHDAVKALLKLNALPDWIREEVLFDSHSDTRDLVTPSAKADDKRP